MSDTNEHDTVDDVPSLGGGASRAVGPIFVDAAGRTHVGHARKSNEDNFHITRFGRYLRTVASSLTAPDTPDDFEQVGYGFAVADGVGGSAAGEVASRLAITLIIDLVLQTPDWVFAENAIDVRTVMARTARRFGLVNDAVVAEAAARPGLRGMGSTLSLAISMGAELIVAHVGDSPVFLYRGGRLLRLTRDHTVPTSQLGVHPAVAARVRLALTHAIGIPATGGAPELSRHKLADRDRILLCTDGLTDLVSEDDIADELGRVSAEDACQALVGRALDRGGGDNVTVVVASFRFPGTAGTTG
ncbi:PP2C family protein-serine/threonine phosphatase [Urbifossiella limnaea]|uniref:Serine/threonine phosphatase stp n=1 Tax=Urbifossiella limnaea TaxID=2528023 RepID=A0A517XS71_9BACT|nr:protein phosphatase 2C domain-containing protein [Urbifossiella limnaea]QDU20360.1 Serine/threonine phosphatase stp [Urbifossiella limnaea]